MQGVDKEIGFLEEVTVKEYDEQKPIDFEFRKVRNFVQKNKNKFKSRLKNAAKSKQKSVQGHQKGNVKKF